MIKALNINPIVSPLSADVALPGSKSITNRALIIAALSNSNLKLISLNGALFSRDTEIMIKALKNLGFEIFEDKKNHKISLKGYNGTIPNKKAIINVGNAGTAARFITAMLALQKNGKYELDGDEQMRLRPMKGLIDTLEQLGAAKFEYASQAYHFPFTMRTFGINKDFASTDAAASSQILSALLIALQASGKDVKIKCNNVRKAYIKITESVKSHFLKKINGLPDIAEEKLFNIKGEGYASPKNQEYNIEPDISAASYFFALCLLHGGALNFLGLPSSPIQGDAAFLDILKFHGLNATKKNNNWLVQRDPTVSFLNPISNHDFSLFSDTFITYAAIAPLINDRTIIKGIGHTRLQETDRIKAMANELKKLGQIIIENDDSLEIISCREKLINLATKARSKGDLLSIETYEDHRFAMSFSILGTFDLLKDGKPWLNIKNPKCCSKTFPNFFKTLESISSEN